MKITRTKISSFLMRFITISLLIVFSISCTQQLDKKTEKPKDFIPRGKMIDILTDMQLMEEIVSSSAKGRLDKEEEKYFIHQSIMVKYDITRQQFIDSYHFYKNDFEDLNLIYKAVEKKLLNQKDKLKTDTINE